MSFLQSLFRCPRRMSGYHCSLHRWHDGYHRDMAQLSFFWDDDYVYGSD